MWEGENVITRASYANNGCSILYKNHRKLSVATLLQFMLGLIMLSLGISIGKSAYALELNKHNYTSNLLS